MEMWLLLILAVLSTRLVTCEVEEDNKLAGACKAEHRAKTAFDEYFGDEDRKDSLLRQYLDLRTKRLELGAECPNELKINDEEVLKKLCLEEVQSEAYHEMNKDRLLRNKLDKQTKRSSWRRKKFSDQLNWDDADKTKCPSTDPNTSGYDEFASKLRSHFDDSCKKEAEWFFIVKKLTQALQEMKIDLQKSFLGDTGATFAFAKNSRLEFCQGDIAVCCGRQTVDDGRLSAIVQTAKIAIEMAKELVDIRHLEFERMNSSHNLDDEKSDREMKKEMARVMKDEYESLLRLKRFYKKELNYQQNEAMKEQFNLALKLINTSLTNWSRRKEQVLS